MDAPTGWNERGGMYFWYEANQHGDRYRGVVHFARKGKDGERLEPVITQKAPEDQGRAEDAMAFAHQFAVALIDSGAIQRQFTG